MINKAQDETPCLVACWQSCFCALSMRCLSVGLMCILTVPYVMSSSMRSSDPCIYENQIWLRPKLSLSLSATSSHIELGFWLLVLSTSLILVLFLFLHPYLSARFHKCIIAFALLIDFTFGHLHLVSIIIPFDRFDIDLLRPSPVISPCSSPWITAECHAFMVIALIICSLHVFFCIIYGFTLFGVCCSSSFCIEHDDDEVTAFPLAV